jgi:hypothetical protein
VDGRVVSSDVVRGYLRSPCTQHTHPQYSIDCSSIEHLSEGTRNAPWWWQCNAETCRSYHTWLMNWKNNCCIGGFTCIFLLGILIFKGLTACRLYKSFSVKGLTVNKSFEELALAHFPQTWYFIMKCDSHLCPFAKNVVHIYFCNFKFSLQLW